MNIKEIEAYLVENFSFDPNFTVKDAKNYHLYFYMQVAKSLGIKTYRFPNKALAFFKKGEKQFYISHAETPLNSYVSALIAGKKKTTNYLLSYHNLPVPESHQVNSLEELNKVYEKLKHSIVVKPDQGIAGRGITILPKKNELEKAWNYCNLYRNTGNVIVEEFIAGNNYRLLVIGNKVVAAAKRVPAKVIGDGTSTIKKLIEDESDNRKKNGLSEITVDSELERRLENENLNMKSTPPKNKTIYLRYNSNLSTGGTTEECLKEVNENYLKLAVDACKAIDLKFGGVDLITPNIGNPNVKHAINEINRAPGLRIHYFPDKGVPQNVAKAVIQEILK